MEPENSPPEALARLRAVADDPLAYLASRGDKPSRAGKSGALSPAIGYVCSYVPEEIILAARLHPVRLGAQPGPTGPANGCLQSFACSFARGLLDGLLTGRWSGLSGVIFAHTCDSLRAAFESWKVHAPEGAFFHFLNLPARVEGPGVTAYAASEMARLAAALTGVPGARPVTAEGLTASCQLAGALRQGLGRLALLRSTRPDLLPGSAFITVARAVTVLDREEAVRLVAALADELEARAGQASPLDPAGQPGQAASAPRRRRPRVLVSGGFLETEEPLRLVEQAGADIVWDDLCLGGRRLAFADAGVEGAAGLSGIDASGAADALSGLLARLADFYLRRVPCPAKHPPARRLDWLCAQAEERGVEGVVFLLQKFCDPHAFDYPAFRGRLEASGWPCLLIEIEQGAAAAGQASTRLEAFVERLSSLPPRRRAPASVTAGATGGARR